MSVKTALLELITAHILTSMLIAFMAPVMCIIIVNKIQTAVYNRTVNRKDVKDAERYVKYYAAKPLKSELRIIVSDKKAFRRFSVQTASKYIKAEELKRAAERAWFNEACSFWIKNSEPDFMARIKPMRGYAKHLCKNIFHNAVNSMPSGTDIIIRYQKPNGKRSKPRYYHLTTDEITGWLHDMAPVLKSNIMLRAMRHYGYKCAKCGKTLDECRRFELCINNKKYEPKCKNCIDGKGE